MQELLRYTAVGAIWYSMATQLPHTLIPTNRDLKKVNDKYAEHPRCHNPECPESWMGVSGKAAWLASHV